jgi:pyruvate,water dikinase
MMEKENECLTVLSVWQRPIFRNILMLSRKYMELRENQRFVWQKTLAFQRRLFIHFGRLWLERPEDIFCATLEEVKAAVLDGAPVPNELIGIRCAELHKLEEEHRRAPDISYPTFLQGDNPISYSRAETANRYTGLPVSPGIGRGPVRIVLSSDHLDRIQPGDVLVTRGADPGWTPVFSLLSGLVLETGGQLSHGAVLAREYNLPAVAALPNITTLLSEGQMVLVDGRSGQVIVEGTDVTLALQSRP